MFLIRGQLLKRFPNTIIYAHEKDATLNKLKEPSGTPSLHPASDLHRLDPARHHLRRVPEINADSETEIKKWCIVLEEQMTEPRFGFDEPDRPPAGRAQPALGLEGRGLGPGQRRAWSGFLRLANLRQAPPANNASLSGSGERARGPGGARAAAASVPRLFRRRVADPPGLIAETLRMARLQLDRTAISNARKQLDATAAPRSTPARARSLDAKAALANADAEAPARISSAP